VKFTKKGVITIDVAVDEYRTNQIMTRFTVKDTGVGIPQEKISGLFEAFYQVDDSSTRGYEGVGLGLPIAKKLVELMQGDIGVESVSGQGSTFWFRIPLDCDSRVIDCLRHGEHRCIKNEANTCEIEGHHFCFSKTHCRMDEKYKLTGKRALVTDDMELVCQFISDILVDWGMLSEPTVSIDEIFEKLMQAEKKQNPYSLLIIGLGSNENNYELSMALIQKIRATPEIKNIGIILMQPLRAELDLDFFTKYSVEYVKKPIFASELFDAVMNELFQDSASESEECILPLFPPPSSQNNVLRIQKEPIHVLVAEDNRINQIVIQNVLRNSGMTCEIVGDGLAAFDAVMTGQFNVVLMDCQMPVMDGYEATVRIRQWEREQNRQRIPVIALTANVVLGDEEKCVEAGMDAYCNKPVDAERVIATIEHWYRLSCEKR
jgi:CheY-like chemotaxis protein